MSDLVLIADDDRDIVRFVEVNLKLEGFRVATAHDGDDALAKALSLAPNLVLLDVMMPRMDGYEVCSRLRADGRSAHIPVIMLTAKSLSADKVLGLTAGADDYIIKPFDPMELVERVKSTLRKARESQALSALTGLPGSARIEHEIRSRLQLGAQVAVASADLNGFASFNDRYGRERGDQVISLAGQVLKRAAEETAGADGFVGHLGGDDFVAVVPAASAEEFARRATAAFDVRVPSLYDPEDATAGYVEVHDPYGAPRRTGIVSLSIGLAVPPAQSTPQGPQADPSGHRALLAAAAERRDAAKHQHGSSYDIDRSAGG
ncbi:MAG TPA: response regulator [Actinomycetes bacterium]|nr:response regulator [Actinomycetes bacterium]